MKKKIFSAFAAILVLVISVATLVACNPYKNTAIGGGDASAAVESNGGYVVKQGKYVYFINGFVGADADATWGAATKQGIVRAEMKEDGTIDNSTSKLLVPKSIYNSSANGGIAIFGEWVYYATPNIDKDKSGTASTTNTDFMRTKIDGSVTQLIGTIGTRSAEYIFTESRVLYFDKNTVSYIDFAGMKTNKNIGNGQGAVKGTLLENVASIAWAYGSKEMFYVQNAPAEYSYKNYNNLCAINLDGTNQRTLATIDTFLTEGKKPENDQLNVFKYTLSKMYVEQDGSSTIYYTKTHNEASTAKKDGLFMAKAKDVKASEKLLNKIGSTTLVPLGYEEGALAYNANNKYCWYNGTETENPDGTETENPVLVTDASQTIWKVDQEKGIVYFSATSSATALYKISYRGATDNISTVISEGIKTDGLVLDFIGNDFFFFATNDNNYLHTINLLTFDKDAKDAESAYIGIGRPEKEDKTDNK